MCVSNPVTKSIFIHIPDQVCSLAHSAFVATVLVAPLTLFFGFGFDFFSCWHQLHPQLHFFTTGLGFDFLSFPWLWHCLL